MMLAAPGLAASPEEVVGQYNGIAHDLPDFIKALVGTETVTVHIIYADGTAGLFGAKTENGAIMAFQPEPYKDATMALYVSEDVLQKIDAAEDGASAIRAEWGKGIRYEGLSIGNKVKMFFIDVGVWIYSFFSPPRTVAIPTVEPGYTAPREDGFRLNLGNWWRDVPPNRSIDIDPITGVLYSFWLDEDGNVCSGMPSHSGQPNAAIFMADGWAEGVRLEDSTITVERLSALQTDVYAADWYASIGPHIFQYRVNIWRDRAAGLVFRDYTGNPSILMDGRFSFYNVSLSTARPVAAMGAYYDCYYRYSLPVPSVDTGEARQHPTKCLRKQNITAAELNRACAEGRLEGSLAEGYFRIRP